MTLSEVFFPRWVIEEKDLLSCGTETLYTHMNDFPSSIHTIYTVIPKALIFWALICPLSYNPRNYHD